MDSLAGFGRVAAVTEFKQAVPHACRSLSFSLSSPQVSVAVLLDNFITASSQMETEEKLRETERMLRERKARCTSAPQSTYVFEKSSQHNLYAPCLLSLKDSSSEPKRI